MLHPTGLRRSPSASPSAPSTWASPSSTPLTSAAGLAMGGLHPVVARLRDVPQPRLRPAADGRRAAPAAGDLRARPGRASPGPTAPRTTACGTCRSCRSCRACGSPRPRDEATLREALREAVAVTDGPTVVRFPKGAPPVDIPALERRGPVDVLRRGERPDVLLVAVGSMVPMCLAVAERAADHGIEVTVVDPRWVLPVPDELVDAGRRAPAGRHRRGRRPGRGRRARRSPRRCRTPTSTCRCAPSGCRSEFLEHGSRGQVLADVGLTEQDVARRIAEWTAGADRPAPRTRSARR